MSGSGELSSEEMLRVRLQVMKQEHRDLADSVEALEARGFSVQLELRRTKKKKLALKDEITRIEARLVPDIIA